MEDVSRGPRVLVTGFGPFPGAPVNPTSALIEALRVASQDIAQTAALTFEVLPVEYDAVPHRLAAIAERVAPDIAIHFGLSARAEGFMLERLARNVILADRPDNAGRQPGAAFIIEHGVDLATSLPVEAIHAALEARGLPVAWSDDAGGYVCNYLFYLSCARRCGAFAPEMTGFIHVPPLRRDVPEHPHAMAFGDLLKGAKIILAICMDAWRAPSDQ